jgi:hypothetical protein
MPVDAGGCAGVAVGTLGCRKGGCAWGRHGARKDTNNVQLFRRSDSAARVARSWSEESACGYASAVR